MPKKEKGEKKAFISSSEIPRLPTGGVPVHLRVNAPLKSVIPVDEPQNYFTKPLYVAKHIAETRKPPVSPTFEALEKIASPSMLKPMSPIYPFHGREKQRGVRTDPLHLPKNPIMPPPLNLPAATIEERMRFAREGSKKTDEPYERTPVQEFKRGGKVKKTGIVKVHKGELIVAANRVASVDKALKKAGMKPLKK